MGATNSIRQTRSKYHHLDDVTVIEIVTKIKIIREEIKGRTAKMKALASEYGCSLNTLYRLARISLIEMCVWNYKSVSYETDHFELSADAAIYRRRVNRKKSLSNANKRHHCEPFVRSCLAYIKASKIHTIDEAVNTLRKDYSGMTVCTKTFYNWVNLGKIDGFSRKDLPRAPGWKTRPKNWKEYTAEDSRGKSILNRPDNINSREEFGHWEGDLVVGPKDGVNGAYITLLERQTRFFLMIKIKDKKSNTVLEALKRYKESHTMFSRMFKSITFDNGSEFCLWKEMESELGIQTWFGRPYHSCDRGSNENCNGLIRRFIKKGTDINTISEEETRKINIEINRKKRKLFQYSSAEACFNNALLKHGIPLTCVYA